MSLEAVIQENTNTMRELIAVWSKLNAQATAIDKSATITNVTAAGAPVEAKPEKVAKAEKATAKAEPKVEAPAPAQEPAEAPAAAAPAVTFEEVKKGVIALLNAKGRDVALAMLQEFGAAKATELKPEQYAAALAAAKKAMA